MSDDSRKLRMWSLSDCMYDICTFVFDKPLLYVKAQSGGDLREDDYAQINK